MRSPKDHNWPMLHLSIGTAHFHYSCLVLNNNNRIYVRLLGPCFKTGRYKRCRIISKDHTKSLDPIRGSALKSDAEALALQAVWHERSPSCALTGSKLAVMPIRQGPSRLPTPDRLSTASPAPSQICNFSIASASTVSGLFNSLFIQGSSVDI